MMNPCISRVQKHAFVHGSAVFVRSAQANAHEAAAGASLALPAFHVGAFEVHKCLSGHAPKDAHEVLL